MEKINCKMLYNKDTIFALSTVVGKSGIAVFRISGEDAFHTIEHLKISTPMRDRVAHLSAIYDTNNNKIDQALIIKFTAPHSFTGEDTVEIHTHGSIAVINNVVETLNKIFRIADPGEFSRRAFYNKKMDLTQAEGLADLIDAETKQQAKQALKQMSGETKNLYNNWRHIIIQIMSKIEAYIDFSNEDSITDTIISRIQYDVDSLTSLINEHINDKRGKRIREGFKIAIIGAPNTGKSTLINYLSQKNVAITSNIAGTTRDIIETHLDMDGYQVTLLDTAGIRKSNNIDEIEQEGIKRSIQNSKEADLKLALFDIWSLPKLNEEIIDLIDEDTICIASKADYIAEKHAQLFVKDLILQPISTHRNYGLENLIESIKKKIVATQSTSDNLPLVTRERHRRLLSEALNHLRKFDLLKPIELAAEDLRNAANNIGKITGSIKTDEILSEIFMNFCVGK